MTKISNDELVDYSWHFQKVLLKGDKFIEQLKIERKENAKLKKKLDIYDALLQKLSPDFNKWFKDLVWKAEQNIPVLFGNEYNELNKAADELKKERSLENLQQTAQLFADNLSKLLKSIREFNDEEK